MTPHALFRIGAVDAGAQAAILKALEAQNHAALGPLVAIAAQFYEAGGRWTSHEWSALTPVERQACVRAADEVRARDARRLAVLTALAARPGAAERMAAEFDGGEMQEQAETEAMLDGIEAVSAQIPRAP